jgi:hypothetical protein
MARPIPRWTYAAFCALSLVGCGGLGTGAEQTSLSATPSAQPTPSPAWETFTSDRYGYSIGHPADWRVVEQPGNVFLHGMRIGSPGTDLIASRDSLRFNSDDGVVVVSAHELEGTESLLEFTDRVSREAACGGSGHILDDIVLDGEPAGYRTFECGGVNWIQSTALHGDRGYVIWAVAAAEPSALERPINDQFLATFQFTD